MKKHLYATLAKAGKPVKAARVRRATPKRKPATAKRAPLIIPLSCNPAYTPRDVTHEDRATLRSGIYFVQLTAGAPFTFARFSRAEQTFAHHKNIVHPLRVYTCDKDDLKGSYLNAGTDDLSKAQEGAGLLKPYI